MLSPHAEPLAVLWRGQDPVSFSVMLSALDEEGIFYKEFQRRDYAAALSRPFALGFYGLPHWEVRVCASDLNSARFIAEAALRPVSALAVETNWENESENVGPRIDRICGRAETVVRAREDLVRWRSPTRASNYRTRCSIRESGAGRFHRFQRVKICLSVKKMRTARAQSFAEFSNERRRPKLRSLDTPWTDLTTVLSCVSLALHKLPEDS